MAKKNKRVRQGKASSSHRKRLANHPALRLFTALDQLGHGCVSVAEMLVDLDTQRSEARRLVNDALLTLHRAEIQNRIEKGEPAPSPMGSAPDFNTIGNSTECESNEVTNSLLYLAQSWRHSCDRARTALREHGARALDEAHSPGSKAKSVAIGADVDEADRLLEHLNTFVPIARFSLKQDAQRLRDLGASFKATAGGLKSAMELLGWDGPPTQVVQPMQRPIVIAEAAHAANMRPDVLLDRIRNRLYPVIGPKGSYTADLEHILLAVPPKKRQQVRRWADRTSAAE